MLVAFAAVAVAQTPITSPEEIQSGKVYWFDNYMNTTNSWGTLVYVDHENPEYSNKLWSSSVWTDSDGNGIVPSPEDSTQLFSFVKSGDNFYLYSLGAKKFVTWKDDGAWVVDIPTSFITVEANTFENPDYPWNIKFDGDKFIGLYAVNGYLYSGYLYCTGSNPANQIYAWQVYEVGELDNTAELEAYLDAALVVGEQDRIVARENLLAICEKADTLIYDEAGYELQDSEPYPLQVDNPEEPYYISCSNVDPSEGSMAGLIDGDNSTFMHSNWHSVSETNDWLDIDLGAGNELQKFQFSEVSRSGAANDFPASILIQGSNDSFEYTDITTVSGLPQSGGVAWTSDVVEADQAYRYLRFVVTTGTNRIYFHMAEFSLLSAYSHYVYNEEFSSVLEELKQLVALVAEGRQVYENENALKDDYEASYNAIVDQLQYIRDILSGQPDEEVVASLASANELLNLPRIIGYPGEESRATLQAVVDAVTADPSPRQRTVITAAIEAFYNGQDAILPEDGKKYTFTFESPIDRYFYMNRVEEETVLTDSEGNDSVAVISSIVLEEVIKGEAYPATAAYVCRHNEDGTLTFIADNGEFLIYRDGTSSAAGNCVYGIQKYEDEYSNINLIRIIPTSYAVADSYEAFWGYVAWYSKRSDSRGYGCIVSKTDGSGFDGASAPFFNDNYTSAIRVAEYDPEDTSIEEIATEVVVKGIYDLSGRLVENPVKGVYIVNGKKVLVK